MSIFILVLELIGSAAFAVSGAIMGIKKGMDIFGVCILGLTVAVGGGVLRDIILGEVPPAMFQNPVYAAVGLATCFIMFIPQVRLFLMSGNILMLLTDSIGLGIFTMSGTAKAFDVSAEPTMFLAVFVGVVTGVGGGVIRDIISGERPYIFVKHIYATAAISGGILFCILLPALGKNVSMLIGSAVIILIRILASHFKWSLPKINSIR